VVGSLPNLTPDPMSSNLCKSCSALINDQREKDQLAALLLEQERLEARIKLLLEERERRGVARHEAARLECNSLYSCSLDLNPETMCRDCQAAFDEEKRWVDSINRNIRDANKNKK